VSVGLVVGLAIGLSPGAMLLVLAIALYRHLKLLGRSVKQFQEAVQPGLEDLQREAARAQEHAERLGSSAPAREGGAKLRG
jgi:hypothetical protein